MPKEKQILYPNKCKEALQKALSMPQYYAFLANLEDRYGYTRRTLYTKFAGESKFCLAEAEEISKATKWTIEELFQYELTKNQAA